MPVLAIVVATILFAGHAVGLIVLPLAWQARKHLAALSASDWREALALTLVGNLLYYFCLSGAILRIGSPLAAMLIGTLPVVTAGTTQAYGQLLRAVSQFNANGGTLASFFAFNNPSSLQALFNAAFAQAKEVTIAYQQIAGPMIVAIANGTLAAAVGLGLQLWIPEGFAHGFMALQDDTHFLYKTTDVYAKDCERSIRWDDPAIGITWPSPGTAPRLAPKDAEAPLLAAADKPPYAA